MHIVMYKHIEKWSRNYTIGNSFLTRYFSKCNLMLRTMRYCIKCKYCPEIESVIHGFVQCKHNANLWRQVELWLRKHVDSLYNISYVEKSLEQKSTIVRKKWCNINNKRNDIPQKTNRGLSNYHTHSANSL